MTVSIPEKTLEHWSSTYILNRYRTNVTVWWPADGADVAIGDLGYEPGKAYWLELKTATWDPAGTHVVKVNLWQLENYRSQAVPVYYVFPVPRWNGLITGAAARRWLGRARLTDLAYWRGGAKCFYHWTYVLPGWEVYSLLKAEISRRKVAGTFSKTSEATLVTVDPVAGTLRWSRNLAHLPRHLTGWHEFWATMDRCGNAYFPALYMLDTASALQALRRRPQVTREALVASLVPGELAEGLRYFAPESRLAVAESYSEIEPEEVFPGDELEGAGGSQALVTIPYRSLKI